MSSTAASGGYYIAMDADEIWASPATLTGSIGVFAVFPTIERALGKIGVTTDGVGTTPLAGALRIDRTLDEGSRARSYSSPSSMPTACSSVMWPQLAKRQSKKSMPSHKVAYGPASMRTKNGLVDKLGPYREALNAAAERAGLGKDYKVEYIEPPLGWRQALARQSQVLAARITRRWCQRNALTDARTQAVLTDRSRTRRALRVSADPKQVYYYCPCSVN